MTNRILALIAPLMVVAAVAACSGSDGTLTLADPWARPGSSGAETAVYLTVTNAGTATDTLVSASSPGAASVEIHETSTDASGMMGMHPIDGIEIPAGGSVTLEPGGKHLMVMGLKDDLAVGDTLEMDLVFGSGANLKVQAEVR